MGVACRMCLIDFKVVVSRVLANSDSTGKPWNETKEKYMPYAGGYISKMSIFCLMAIN